MPAPRCTTSYRSGQPCVLIPPPNLLPPCPILQVWSPELLKNAAGGGVRDMVESWIKGMLDVGTLIRRLDTGEGELRRRHVCGAGGRMAWQQGPNETRAARCGAKCKG